MITKPILAATLKELSSFASYPVYVTMKLDGIRCITKGGKLLSRMLKPIPNKHIQETLSSLPDGLDGELMVGNFNTTQSSVMSVNTIPYSFKYCIFDYVKDDVKKPYLERIEDLKKLNLPDRCELIIPTKVKDFQELRVLEQKAISEGFEGVILRSGGSPYKNGRSTLKEGYLIKYKRFFDSEAEIIGFEELTSNSEIKIDNLGNQKRGCKKENEIGKETLGALIVIVPATGVIFKVASGLDDALRAEIWINKENYLNKTITYRYQEITPDGKPRFPTLVGIRKD